MTLQEQINTAREDMIFREEQLHGYCIEHYECTESPYADCSQAEAYDAARDRYLLLLAEYRLAQLAQMPR